MPMGKIVVVLWQSIFGFSHIAKIAFKTKVADYPVVYLYLYAVRWSVYSTCHYEAPDLMSTHSFVRFVTPPINTHAQPYYVWVCALDFQNNFWTPFLLDGAMVASCMRFWKLRIWTTAYEELKMHVDLSTFHIFHSFLRVFHSFPVLPVLLF